MGLKIVTIGGGSSYSPELIEGLIARHDVFPVTELCFVDIEAGKERLEIIVALAQRMIEHAGITMKVTSSLNRKEALVNADFVTTQFRVGQLAARMQDEAIPFSHHVLGQETNGPGGLFKGLRTIPIIIELCHEMEEICPTAWLINFTNPAGMITEAVVRHTNFKRFIGLCSGPLHLKHDIMDLFAIKEENRVYVEFVGLNHLIFAKRVFVDGVDRTSEAVDLFSQDIDQASLKNIANLPWNTDFIGALNMIPMSYLKYYYKQREMLHHGIEEAATVGTRAQQVKAVELALFERYKDPTLNIKPAELEARGGAYYSDAACELMVSIFTNRGDIQTLNVKNNGAILGLDTEAAVEVNCVVTSHGPMPITTGSLPTAVHGLVQQIKSFEILACEAAIEGDYNKALLAMTINPLVDSDEIAQVILDELFAVHAQDLPRFQTK